MEAGQGRARAQNLKSPLPLNRRRCPEDKKENRGPSQQPSAKLGGLTPTQQPGGRASARSLQSLSTGCGPGPAALRISYCAAPLPQGTGLFPPRGPWPGARTEGRSALRSYSGSEVEVSLCS